MYTDLFKNIFSNFLFKKVYEKYMIIAKQSLKIVCIFIGFQHFDYLGTII
jgi:hypothetical protein